MTNRIRIPLLIINLLIVSVLGYTSEITPAQQTKVRTLINLMDYIAKDYGHAVEENLVVDSFEFNEMTEFSSNALSFHTQLVEEKVVADDPELNQSLAKLQSLIASKASLEEVRALSNNIRDGLLDLGLLPLSPSKWPNASKGKTLFMAQCASCHGITGAGDGPAGKGLTPSPTNFTDMAMMNGISPLQAFNTITLGVEGTSMRAFSELSENEIWDLAFYVMTLPFPEKSNAENQPVVDLVEAASLSNNDLLALYPTLNVGAFRANGNKETNDPLSLVRGLLGQSEEASNRGDQNGAITLALRAYLQGIEPIEPKIKASDNDLFERLESTMMGLRETLAKGDADAISAKFAESYSILDEVETVIGNSERSMWMTATITISILLREGLEAFFVILAILGMLQSMGATRAIKWVHSGWILALLVGLAGMFFASSLMQWDAQSRELMEGLISLFAVLVLLYLGFWMHGKSNAAKWKEYIQSKIKAFVKSDSMFGLAAFSFLVVFREAFESVLFLTSLTADGSVDSTTGVIVGAVISALMLFGIAWAMMRWFKKLPIAKVFLYSSIAILALAVILTGEGIHAIQEGGYIGIHSFPVNIKLSLIGLFPTYETILGQLAVLGIIIVLWRINSAKMVEKAVA